MPTRRLPIVLAFLCLVGCASSNAERLSETQKAARRASLYRIKKVLFIAAKDDGKRHVYMMDSNGANVRAITSGVGNEATPAFLPGGKIVFASDRTGRWQIYICRLDGSQVRPLTTSTRHSSYAPTPTRDGSIVFVSDETGNDELYAMNPDGSRVFQITRGGFTNANPVVSEEGLVYYSSARNGRRFLYEIRLDGSEERRLPIPLPQMLLDTPAILPPYIRDPLHTTEVPLTGFVQPEGGPQPRIVFSARDANGDINLYRVQLDGQRLLQLTNSHGYNTDPVVLRDGRILYATNRDGAPNVWIMTPDGSKHANLTKTVGGYAGTR